MGLRRQARLILCRGGVVHPLTIFPTLKRNDAFQLVRLMAVLIWSVAVIGIGAWIWAAQMPPKPSITTTGDQGPVTPDTNGIEFGQPKLR